MNPEGKGLVSGAHRKHYVYRWLRTEELPAGHEDLREDWADYIQRRVEKYGEGARVLEKSFGMSTSRYSSLLYSVQSLRAGRANRCLRFMSMTR